MAPQGHLKAHRRRTVLRRGAAGVALAVAVLLLAACDSPPVETVPEPETVETCDGLVDVGAQLTRAYVRVLEELRTDALLSEELPPEFVELERIGRDLDSRVASLGCDAATLNAEISEAVADLVTESPAAQSVLDIVDAGLVSTTTVPPSVPEGTGATDGESDDLEDVPDVILDGTTVPADDEMSTTSISG